MSRGPAKRKRPLWVPLGAMAVGLLLFLFAAAGGVETDLLPLRIEARSWQLLLSGVGIGLIALGVLLLADEREGQERRQARKTTFERADYQIKMKRPRRFHRKMTIYGEYVKQPPQGSLRLFTVKEDGRFRPQSMVTFDEKARRWSGRVDLGPGPYYSVYVVAALVDGPGLALWEYFYQVGQKTEWEPVDGGFRDYAVECDRFLVEGVINE